jgi:hypothetical protein
VTRRHLRRCCLHTIEQVKNAALCATGGNAKAARALVLGQPFQPVGNFLVLVAQHGAVAKAGLADLVSGSGFLANHERMEGTTGKCDTGAPLQDCIHGYPLTGRCMAHSPRGTCRRDGLNAFFQAPPSEDRLGHTHLAIHPLETAVLFGHVLYLSNQRCIHSTEFGPPIIKTGAAHPMLPTQLRDWRAALCLFQNAPSRQILVQSPAGQCMTCASLNRAVFIKNLLRYLAEKILLLNTTKFGGITRRLAQRRSRHKLNATKFKSCQ